MPANADWMLLLWWLTPSRKGCRLHQSLFYLKHTLLPLGCKDKSHQGCYTHGNTEGREALPLLILDREHSDSCFSGWPGVWEQLYCGIASQGHRGVVRLGVGWAVLGFAPDLWIRNPGSLSCAFPLRWGQWVQFRQQVKSCLLEWYLEIKAQITSGNTVIQKSPMLMELDRNMLWLVLAGQRFGTWSQFVLIDLFKWPLLLNSLRVWCVEIFTYYLWNCKRGRIRCRKSTIKLVVGFWKMLALH